ncbi:hypothetical protein D9M68_557090 [compost metagenome]
MPGPVLPVHGRDVLRPGHAAAQRDGGQPRRRHRVMLVILPQDQGGAVATDLANDVANLVADDLFLQLLAIRRHPQPGQAMIRPWLEAVFPHGGGIVVQQSQLGSWFAVLLAHLDTPPGIGAGIAIRTLTHHKDGLAAVGVRVMQDDVVTILSRFAGCDELSGWLHPGRAQADIEVAPVGLAADYAEAA